MRGSKDEIRRMVWDLLASRGVARNPLPPHGRIPNFAGAEEAARRILGLPEWRRAGVVKVNPDSPQRHVRLRALVEGKTLVMPTPRLRSGFIVIDPSRIPPRLYAQASTIRGAFRLGILYESLEDLMRALDRVDFIVEGSVAVNRWGERLGKGEGYGELEYAILLEVGMVEAEVPIATSVHDLQVLGQRLPQDPWDVPVDYIATPTRLIRAENRGPRPPGVLWDMVRADKLAEIPVLRELGRRMGREML
ncbi:MAG: 5-formyltetrahydrofolate cyclo-ligase [Desulfurococcales archaeon]|nr:5-formyltetrahydrofolate cyclo-ligase [Desulfurococcales archaeon]